MNLGVLEGHFSIASLFKCHISYLWRVARSLCICRASCSLSKLTTVCTAQYAITTPRRLVQKWPTPIDRIV